MNELTTFYNFAIIGTRSDCGNVFVERQGWKVKKIPAAAEVSHGGCGDFCKTRI